MPKKIRVLLIEDNSFDADILQEQLDEGQAIDISLIWVDRMSKAERALETDSFDLILLDVNLPDSDGLATLFRAKKLAPKLPIIILSGLSDEEVAIEAVQNGAQDYLVKGQFSNDILTRSILYAIERKVMTLQLEEQFRQAEAANQKLAAVLESMSEGVCKIDLDGRIVYINAAAERILGVEFGQIKSLAFHELVHPLEAKKIPNCDFLTGEHAEPRCLRIEDMFYVQPLAEIPVEFSCAPIIIQDQPTGLVICFRDISEQKIVEKRVKEFYSSVSHELRTPLTSINGSLQLIELGLVGPVEAEVQEMITVAREGCDRLLRLINDLLDIKKIEAGQLELKDEPINPQLLVDKCIEAMLGYAVHHKVELAIEQGPLEIDLIRGDQDRLLQVLLNLVSNALKFSGQGDIVTIKVEQPDRSLIRFSVSDTGPGIAAHDRDKLFRRFQQLDSSDTRSHGGTGLGLAISKALVEQHGGQIGVYSQPGEGSTFWFELPTNGN